MVWTYRYGKGKVCYAVPGHTSATMSNPIYQKILQPRVEMGDRMDKLKLAIVGCGDIAGFTALISRLVPQVNCLPVVM